MLKCFILFFEGIFALKYFFACAWDFCLVLSLLANVCKAMATCRLICDVTPYIWSCRCWRGGRVSLQVALIGWGAAQRKSTSTSSSLTAFIATHPLNCFFRVNCSSCCCLAFSQGSFALPWPSKQAQYADWQTNLKNCIYTHNFDFLLLL